ncbi:hypothetical protein HMI56_005602, partial [Coelomomyces lativittatus]
MVENSGYNPVASRTRSRFTQLESSNIAQPAINVTEIPSMHSSSPLSSPTSYSSSYEVSSGVPHSVPKDQPSHGGLLHLACNLALPKFPGGNTPANAWLSQFERLIKSTGLQQKYWGAALQTYLPTGLTNSVSLVIMEAESVEHPWEFIKTELKKYFCISDDAFRQKCQEDFKKIKQGTLSLREH